MILPVLEGTNELKHPSESPIKLGTEQFSLPATMCKNLQINDLEM
jgi:hypothetical protein